MAQRSTRKSLQDSVAHKLAREFKGVAVGPVTGMPGGAHTVGIGRKIVDGKPTDELALRYYVEKKRPLDALSSERAIPEKHTFYSRLRQRRVSVVTDVIESPRPEPEQNPRERLRPVPGGASIGTPPPAGFVDAGTLGGWVWDLEDDSIVMLSNEHVLGTNAGEEIVQPGTLDGGVFPDDIIGSVKRGIPRSTVATNTVDCSIGDPSDADVFDSSVIDVAPAVYAIGTAVLDMEVEKFGRTTEHTFGIVTDVDVTTALTSGHTFTDCIRVDVASPSGDWSDGGDSGSLVFSRETLEDSDIKPAVALHFAGAGTHGIECKIQNVFSALNLTTLCSGAFAAFLDSLFEAETAGEAITVARFGERVRLDTAVLERARGLPASFFRRDRALCRSGRMFNGISRDLQARLTETGKGRKINAFVDAHRDELLRLLIRNGDVRRATVDAFRPLLAGAVTTGDVLERTLTETDVERLSKLGAQLRRTASSAKLKASLTMIESLGKRAAGKSIADVIDIERP